MKQSFYILCLLGGLLSVSCQKKDSAVASASAQAQRTQMIWEQDFSEHISSDVSIDASQTAGHNHSVQVGLEKEMECKVIFTSVSGDDNGLYIQNAQVQAPEGTSYTFSIEQGNPFNKGTLEAPIMAIPLIIQFQHDNGRQFGGQMVTIAGDGTLSLPEEE